VASECEEPSLPPTKTLLMPDRRNRGIEQRGSRGRSWNGRVWACCSSCFLNSTVRGCGAALVACSSGSVASLHGRYCITNYSDDELAPLLEGKTYRSTCSWHYSQHFYSSHVNYCRRQNSGTGTIQPGTSKLSDEGGPNTSVGVRVVKSSLWPNGQT
jgi:hypothetical protein